MTSPKILTDARFRVIDVSALPYEQRNVLADDVRSIVEDEYPAAFSEGAPSEAFPNAERILLARIGGQRSVKGYVAVLMAGVARRGAAR